MRTHLDLCSGIGGFALAARWLGMQTIGFVEIDPFCQRVLAKNFPGVPIHDDLTTLDAGTVRSWKDAGVLVNAARSDGKTRGGDGLRTGEPSERSSRSGLDLITGGYPCQPFSLAGKRLGAEDDRHLWPYIAALVAELRPRYCLFENVAGHITLGLDRVLADLETLGYTCRPVVVPACALNAPHRRDRVWLMAESNGDTRGVVPNASGRDRGARSERTGWDEPRGISERPVGVAPNADRAGRRKQRWAVAVEAKHAAIERRRRGQTEPGLGFQNDGLPRWVDGRVARSWDGDWECGVPRVTDGCADRANKLKALGNAIVPQVAYTLMSAMEVR